jgi:hypothetical protein
MDERKQQSVLQGGVLAGLGVAFLFAVITFVTEGAVDWGLVWVVGFMTVLPWAVYAYKG